MSAAHDPLIEALRRLPRLHSLALRLREAGVPEGLMAECLQIEPEGLGPLFAVAEAKLAALLEEVQKPP